MFLHRTVLIFCLPLLAVWSACAQGIPEKSVRGIDRWAFKTNIIGWTATLPNFSVEYDLGRALNNKMTLSLSARYNWDSYQRRLPYYVFNLMQFRPEFRYYWRSLEELPFVPAFIKETNPDRVKYFGIYADAGTYSFKPGKTGRQGTLYSVGVSAGFGIPRYQYRSGYVDIEVGASVGLAMATVEAFTLNADANRYDYISSRSHGLRVLPFPLVSSLNLSLAWRSRSIKDKYKFTNADRIRRQEKEVADREAKERRIAESAAKKEAAAVKRAARKSSKEAAAKERAEKKSANAKARTGKKAVAENIGGGE